MGWRAAVSSIQIANPCNSNATFISPPDGQYTHQTHSELPSRLTWKLWVLYAGNVDFGGHARAMAAAQHSVLVTPECSHFHGEANQGAIHTYTVAGARCLSHCAMTAQPSSTLWHWPTAQQLG